MIKIIPVVSSVIKGFCKVVHLGIFLIDLRSIFTKPHFMNKAVIRLFKIYVPRHLIVKDLIIIAKAGKDDGFRE